MNKFLGFATVGALTVGLCSPALASALPSLPFGHLPTFFHQFTGTSLRIPEPISISLFGAGLAGAAILRRRKRKSSNS